MSSLCNSSISQAISVNKPAIQSSEASVDQSGNSDSFFYFEDQSVVQEEHSSLHPQSSASSPQIQEPVSEIHIQQAFSQLHLDIDSQFNLNNSTVDQKDQNSHDQTSFFNDSYIRQLIASEDYQQDQQYQYNLFDKHAQEVITYLITLSNPFGQIVQICQHLQGFSHQTIDHQFMNDNSEWVWTLRIHLPISDKEPPRAIEKTQSKENKLRAKQLASFDLLKSLYLTCPSVWYQYKDVKQIKKLHFPEQKHQHSEIKLFLSQKNFKKISNKTMIKFQSPQKINIRSMMEKISAKTERNILIQHLPDEIKSPEPQIKMENGKWKVSVSIVYLQLSQKIEKQKKIYKKTQEHQNSKIAEEHACMQAIIKMYECNPDLYEKVKKIKMVRKLKDPPPKSLPILPNQ